MINPSWQEQGLVRIVLSRKQPDGNLVFGVYLVDIFCLGLKNTFCNANCPLSKYETEIKPKAFRDVHPVDCPSELAHRIIYGAIEYASELGFKPQKDFKLSKCILDEKDKIGEMPKIDFGKDGKPFFIAGPDDNAELIISKLDKKLGTDNFHYLFPG